MHGANVQGAPRRIGTARRLYDWRGGLKELREFRRAGLPHPRAGQAEGKALAVALATASDPAVDALHRDLCVEANVQADDTNGRC